MGSIRSQPQHDANIAYALNGNCYLNITSRCTLRCPFCPKHNRSWEVRNYDLSLSHEPSVDEIMAAVGDPSDYREMVFCGLGEPTQRLKELLEVATLLKAQGCIIRINSDGLASLIHGRDVVPELLPVVDSLSISLNAQDEETYIRHTRPKLDGAYGAMLDFIATAHQGGIEVTLTAIDGLEGVDIDACQGIAEALGVTFRRRQLDEVG